MPKKNKNTCPCNPETTYKECCAIFIVGKSHPQTPEQLMRSRYTAYALANIDYIERTMKGPAAVGFDRVSAKKWAESVQWVRLKIVETRLDPNEDVGYVEFIAYYRDNDVVEKIHENSEFRREDGQWYYWDSVHSESQGEVI